MLSTYRRCTAFLGQMCSLLNTVLTKRCRVVLQLHTSSDFWTVTSVLTMSYTERDTKYTNWWKIPQPWSFFSKWRTDDCINGQLFVSHWSSTSVKYFFVCETDVGWSRKTEIPFESWFKQNWLKCGKSSAFFFLTHIMCFHHALFGIFCNDNLFVITHRF